MPAAALDRPAGAGLWVKGIPPRPRMRHPGLRLRPGPLSPVVLTGGGHDFLVAFSCEGRRACPSCNARPKARDRGASGRSCQSAAARAPMGPLGAEAPALVPGARAPRRQRRPARLSEGYRGPSSRNHSDRLAQNLGRLTAQSFDAVAGGLSTFHRRRAQGSERWPASLRTMRHIVPCSSRSVHLRAALKSSTADCCSNATVLGNDAILSGDRYQDSLPHGSRPYGQS